MSSGQRPRRPEFFPSMKYRARKRHRKQARIIWYDQHWQALWPQPDMTRAMLTVETGDTARTFDRWTGRWSRTISETA